MSAHARTAQMNMGRAEPTDLALAEGLVDGKHGDVTPVVAVPISLGLANDGADALAIRSHRLC